MNVRDKQVYYLNLNEVRVLNTTEEGTAHKFVSISLSSAKIKMASPIINR